MINKINLLYPEVSYKIVGSAFDVYNNIGSGFKESYYQKGLKEAFIKNNLKFIEHPSFPLRYNNKIIGRKIFDFLVEDKIVVEIKKGERFSKMNIDQVLEYLKTKKLELAILMNFGKNGVQFKRIINLSY
ncbi:MAG: GxxExxY protein [Candidatus Paceibacterota bacterium]|jgi:GxxExxY protein